jgi:hypothetical protein
MKTIKYRATSKETMIQWLYRYIFRGFGILFLIGMVTILYLAIASRV